MINGMNWDYYPIGTNYTYSLWKQPDIIIKAALKSEMSLLKELGVNAIRQYSDIPARWIQYIYEEYGIYTMLNHSFGRYGLTIDGKWVANTEYEDIKSKDVLLAEVSAMVKSYQNTPGLLLYLLGNENNYGLFWEGPETEDIPEEDLKSEARARALYKLFNEATLLIKSLDSSHPVAICNGDLQYLHLIKQECTAIDILGTNMYRGISFGDAFERVKTHLNKPLLFTEFGSDAYNALRNEEDQEAQARFILENWKEIYSNAAGLGKSGNSLGGFTFQFSDGWWKHGQTLNLDIHDTHATWANGGYDNDYTSGKNNMNEEWFGICAKSEATPDGLYSLFPRKAYFLLQKVHQINPIQKGITLPEIENHFLAIREKPFSYGLKKLSNTTMGDSTQKKSTDK